MMLVVCSSIACKTVTRIYAGSVNELTNLVGERCEWWANKYKCPSCERQATAVYEGQVDPNEFQGFSVRSLEAADFFRFMMGVGLPEEMNCDPNTLADVFRSGKVTQIKGHAIRGSSHFCVEWLEMEDGTRLYFGSSSHGAAIFRITKKSNFAERETGDGTGR